jgi:solute carrier family 6 GABA transporter-like protein 1
MTQTHLSNTQGNQLRRDLNVIVGTGKNWKIPSFLPFLLRYISGPVLAIILSFAFPEFHKLRFDPLMVLGFIVSILGISVIILGFVMPRYFDVLVPQSRRAEGTELTIANELKREVSLTETTSEPK